MKLLNAILPSIFALGAVAAFGQTARELPANGVWLESLDLGKVKSFAPPLGYPAKAAQSVAGKPLTMKGVVYPHGVGMHSGSKMLIDLHGEAESFAALVGVDDAMLPLAKPLPGAAVPRGLQNHPGTAAIQVWVDGKLAAEKDKLRRGGNVESISVDLRGARRMVLVVSDGGRWPYNNPADLAGAAIVMKAGAKTRPEALPVPTEREPEIGKVDSTVPAIHGPRVVGASPGRPFLFLIPATGAGPLKFAARNLPAGLTLDAGKGIISGAIQREGDTVVELTVSGPRGTGKRALTIAAHPGKLALTPPLGWNSWNVWANAVDDAKVRAAADWMVKSGLAAHGYQYINIDDAWMGTRDANGEIQPNAKFPDMKALADYVHSKGLKMGIYSSPGPKTCQQLEGSLGHERQDAATYARWGIDFLKYDMCSYSGMIKNRDDREENIKPYRIMGEALRPLPRDIVFNLCQYGNAKVQEWAPQIGGQVWRTTGDIRDSWESTSEIGFRQNGLEPWAGPGRWNDPDMLVLGALGWGVELHPTRLTPNEQMTHFSLWSLLSSPLLLGCDLSQLDAFSTALLTNDEVLDVSQDPSGRQAARRSQDGLLEVWSKKLSDGSVAVGLFNRGIEAAAVTAKWSDIGVSGKQPVRDLWRRKNLPDSDGAFTATVPAHGTVLVKVGRPVK